MLRKLKKVFAQYKIQYLKEVAYEAHDKNTYLKNKRKKNKYSRISSK